jgi:hypothetical protein
VGKLAVLGVYTLWLAKAFRPGQGPRKSLGPGATYSWPLPLVTLMNCAFSLKIGMGSNSADAASAPACRPFNCAAISEARARSSGSAAAASIIAAGNALASGANAASESGIDEKCILIVNSKVLRRRNAIECLQRRFMET